MKCTKDKEREREKGCARKINRERDREGGEERQRSGIGDVVTETAVKRFAVNRGMSLLRLLTELNEQKCSH